MDPSELLPHEKIANILRREIVAGEWDRTDRPFPAVRAIAERFDVAPTTAGRAVDALVTLGHLRRVGGTTRPPVVAPPETRQIEWSSTGRYARARAARDLIYAGPLMGEMTKETVSREWITPPAEIADLLGDTAEVLARTSRTTIDGEPAELTTMHFPRPIVDAVPALDEEGPIKVVEMIEATGRRITGTRNRITARIAGDAEARALSLAVGAVVLVHTHVTVAGDEPVEAVINVRAGDGSAITFDTYEGEPT